MNLVQPPAAAAERPAPPFVVRCRQVSVVVGKGEGRVTALADVSLDVAPGESVVLVGRSGSGKTTLLNVLAGLLTPTSGSVAWGDETLMALDDGACRRNGGRGVAVVFQSPNLFPHFTAYENVALAAWAAEAGATAQGGWPGDPLRLLRLVGLERKADSLPSELSGGEAQRVALARALAQQPRVLFADEPTGHLDSDTSGRVFSLIEALRELFSFSLVVATHDLDLAARLPREIELLDGRVVRDTSHT